MKNHEPSWSKEQQERLAFLMTQPDVTIAYWNSDQFGFPYNHPCQDMAWLAKPGVVQEISGPLEICTKDALHATFSPHKWSGNRVWIVAMFGKIQKAEDKIGGLKREIIGEILPFECTDPSIGVRLGRKDLSEANLSEANLSRANLSRANLSGANLSGANLSGADLSEVIGYKP